MDLEALGWSLLGATWAVTFFMDVAAMKLLDGRQRALAETRVPIAAGFFAAAFLVSWLILKLGYPNAAGVVMVLALLAFEAYNIRRLWQMRLPREFLHKRTLSSGMWGLGAAASAVAFILAP